MPLQVNEQVPFCTLSEDLLTNLDLGPKGNWKKRLERDMEKSQSTFTRNFPFEASLVHLVRLSRSSRLWKR